MRIKPDSIKIIRFGFLLTASKLLDKTEKTTILNCDEILYENGINYGMGSLSMT
jgi:hypothetical protein